MDDWKPFYELPTSAIQAELFYGNLVYTDFETGEKISAIIEPFRDERRQIAYYDGEDWRHMGTGHLIMENYNLDPPEFFPTHWRPLPPLPVTNP
jgi:hypothetical protein